MALLEHSYSANGNVRWWSTGENKFAGLQRVKHRIITGPSNPLLGRYQKKKGGKEVTQIDIIIPMFIRASFTISERSRQVKCSSTEEWIHNTVV